MAVMIALVRVEICRAYQCVSYPFLRITCKPHGLVELLRCVIAFESKSVS